MKRCDPVFSIKLSGAAGEWRGVLRARDGRERSFRSSEEFIMSISAELKRLAEKRG